MSESVEKIALLTGASRGIGRATLHRLAEQGYYVIGTATSSSGVNGIQAFLEEAGLRGEAQILNIADKASIASLITYLTDSDKLPDIFVGNAGITSDDLILRMSDEAWDSVIETNLTGNFRLLRDVIKRMFRKRWGRVVFIGSVVGSSGNPGQANYCAAKAALIGLSRSVAQEMGARGITVNVVAPGFIETDMTESLPELVKTEMHKRIPMKRFGTADDIANTVSFLVSEAANYITGQVIHVNGGLYMG